MLLDILESLRVASAGIQWDNDSEWWREFHRQQRQEDRRKAYENSLESVFKPAPPVERDMTPLFQVEYRRMFGDEDVLALFYERAVRRHVKGGVIYCRECCAEQMLPHGGVVEWVPTPAFGPVCVNCVLGNPWLLLPPRQLGREFGRRFRSGRSRRLLDAQAASRRSRSSP